MTRKERREMVQENMRQATERFNAGKLNAEEYEILIKDGRKCLNEISKRDASMFDCKSNY